MPGLVATSVASNGSVANVAAIAAGTAQSGFVQSDIAYWAYNGTGIYQGRPKVDGLRAIANLYPESIQLVVRKGSGIKSVADLRGRKVSLDEPGSGTLVDARLILSAFGLSEKDLKAEYFRAQQVADSLKDGTIDAFFSVSGWPQSAVADLAATVGIELVPIAGPGGRQPDRAVPLLQHRGDSRQRLQGRRRREDRERARDLGDVEQAERRADLQGDGGIVEPGDAQAARTRATPRAARSASRRRRRASAFRCMPAPKSSTRNRASSNRRRSCD